MMLYIVITGIINHASINIAPRIATTNNVAKAIGSQIILIIIPKATPIKVLSLCHGMKKVLIRSPIDSLSHSNSRALLKKRR